MTIRRIPAEFWRGGTSKGIFLLEHDLPTDPGHRDRLLLRMIGSPDPYGKQIDGMGGATSSTSKIVLVRRSDRADCDVDYRFGAVDIHRPVIDWSGNCGNLTTAVGPLALSMGLVAAREGTTVVRLWQDNIGKRILAHVPVADGQPVEEGDFVMDGVAFPAPEILLEFLDPGGGESALLPTGRVVDTLTVPGVGKVDATLVNAGNPTVFVHASALGLAGTELQPEVNGDADLLARCEAIRSHAAVVMGLAVSAYAATRDRPATPKLSFVAAPASYVASSGREVRSADIALVARILSMGALHHAYTGTGAVALAVAAALPGSVVSQVARGGPSERVRIGHASGTLTAGAEVRQAGADWSVTRALMSRSARRLMSGIVHVPDDGGRVA
jgi:2-methylaconitate isomerase